MLRSCLIILKLTEKFLPEVVDLFSGCGGLAYGFKTSGYKIGHGIELMEAASKTASYNLYWKDGIDTEHICGDITKLSPELIKKNLSDNGCIVIGGPPCQAYSQIGRAKLRSLGENRIHTNDSRGFLFEDFLRYVFELNAKVVVMENVPEATNYGGLNVPQHVCEILEDNNYEAYWTILNAADYGVPQVRKRVFVLAIRKDIEHKFDLPQPTHRAPYGKSRSNEMKFTKFEELKNFRPPNKTTDDLLNWVSVGEAISDLPILFPNSKSRYKLNKLNIYMDYRTEPQNSYQRLMRSWCGEEESAVSGHGYRKTLRDFPIFERMAEGEDFRRASEIADLLLIEACSANGVNQHENEEEYSKLKKKIVPPYDREKFYTKWRRLKSDEPSHTVVAHLNTDTYSHIHPWEARGISVREAARLQSFPDGFLFQCSMGDAYKQIGNAVPPLLSIAIANTMKENLLGS